MRKEEKKLRKRMLAHLKNKYTGVLTWSVENMLDTAYNFTEAEKQFKLTNSHATLKKSMRILDAGCGFGYFVSYCLQQGYNCQGYEVEEKLAKIAQELLTINKQDPKRIFLVKKNKLPYRNETFDFINLHFVLDYVQNIPGLLKELKRILKKDGVIFSICPNYQCFYSPVYALFFIPWLPKKFNRIYFKLMGRPNTAFLESLTFTTPHYLEGLFRKFGLQSEAFGPSYWQKAISEENFEHRSNFLKFIIKATNKLKLTELLKATNRLGFYTPLIYILRKKE